MFLLICYTLVQFNVQFPVCGISGNYYINLSLSFGCKIFYFVIFHHMFINPKYAHAIVIGCVFTVK